MIMNSPRGGGVPGRVRGGRGARGLGGPEPVALGAVGRGDRGSSEYWAVLEFFPM